MAEFAGGCESASEWSFGNIFGMHPVHSLALSQLPTVNWSPTAASLSNEFFAGALRLLNYEPTETWRFSAIPEPLALVRYHNVVNPLLLIIILLLLFGGGGFYLGGPAFGGGGIGLILLVCLIIYLLGGFRSRG